MFVRLAKNARQFQKVKGLVNQPAFYFFDTQVNSLSNDWENFTLMHSDHISLKATISFMEHSLITNQLSFEDYT